MTDHSALRALCEQGYAIDPKVARSVEAEFYRVVRPALPALLEENERLRHHAPNDHAEYQSLLATAENLADEIAQLKAQLEHGAGVAEEYSVRCGQLDVENGALKARLAALESQESQS